MDIKRIIRGPLVWVLLGIVVIWIGSTFLFAGAGFKEISVKHGLELLDGSTVSSATIIDGEQRVNLELSKADGDNGKLVQFYYVAPRGAEIVDAVKIGRAHV